MAQNRTFFDTKLNELEDKVVRLANLTMRQTATAIEVLEKRDLTLAQTVIDNDNELDRELSPVSHSRPLSRSPPASRHSSQSPARSQSLSLADATAAMSLSRDDRELRDRVAAEVSKRHAHQQKKYHSKRGAQRMGGRQKGSKAKMDTRVKPDRSGFWD